LIASGRLLDKGFNGVPLIKADDRVVGDIPFFNDWVKNNTKNNYWKQIDGVERAEKLNAPALLMAGWYDAFLPNQINDFVDIRAYSDDHVASNSQIIIGPWSHARTIKLPSAKNLESFRKESFIPSMDWFDKHLLNRNELNKQTSPVRIFVMGENVWRNEQEWPLERAKYTEYFLRSDGSANGALGDGLLLANAPSTTDIADHYIYDPLTPVPSAGGTMLSHNAGVCLQNDIEENKNILIYTTKPLGEDVEVTGPVELILFVQTSALNTDFTAKLVDVHPNGDAYNVTDGILRQNYIPNQATEIKIKLWPTSMVFKSGHKIRLEVSSSNYPSGLTN